MKVEWTTEQVSALAPDDASAKAGKGLASKRHWATLGKKETALWGECQGSGKLPYQVIIDLTEPAFKCSCPSRKFPCKHGIGLMLLLVNEISSIPDAEIPTWVSDWMVKRTERSEKKEAKKNEEKTPEDLQRAAADQAKRAAARERKVEKGLQELDLWLRDLVRQGFSALPSKPYKFWDDMAARLVDAQAPGVAGILRGMGGIPSSGTGWQSRLLEKVGLLHLLLEGYQRIDNLPEAVREDIRNTIGFSVKQEDVLTQEGVMDSWQILGQRLYEEDSLRIQHLWLYGKLSGRNALILQFAHVSQSLDMTLATGTCFQGELTYFPGNSPLRALLKSRKEASQMASPNVGHTTLESFFAEYANACAANPWIPVYPCALRNVVPVMNEAGWLLCDSGNQAIPIHSAFEDAWNLLAVSGGQPLPFIFGEWDGALFRPLLVHTANRFIIY